ncbi:hypothetical protein [Bermanella sp. R86510]|uniref:hypothetical protein n=1 Tax=unclassified Bermanella TaxID=2627862 RepID=UPI0037C929B8
MTLFIIIFSIILVVGALLVSHHLSQKEKKLTEQRNRGKRILAYADNLWDIAEECSKLIEAPHLVECLLDYYLHQMRLRDNVLNEDHSAVYLPEIQNFRSKLDKIHVIGELGSDNEIKKAKRSFAKASKYLKAAADKKLIGQADAHSMYLELKRRMLDLEVEAYERLGDAAGERKDPAMATNYYKYAKKLLIETNITFDGKTDWIREITNKNQVLFGNAVAEQLEKQIEKEDAEKVDEFGIPKDTSVLAGNKKTF